MTNNSLTNYLYTILFTDKEKFIYKASPDSKSKVPLISTKLSDLSRRPKVHHLIVDALYLPYTKDK